MATTTPLEVIGSTVFMAQMPISLMRSALCVSIARSSPSIIIRHFSRRPGSLATGTYMWTTMARHISSRHGRILGTVTITTAQA